MSRVFGTSKFCFGRLLAGVAASNISGEMLENESSTRDDFLDNSLDICDFLAGVAALRTSGAILEKESSPSVF